jgi:acyl carrier protein
MTKAEFYAELESMLEMEPGTIKGNEALTDLPGWDSMAVISFIALTDSKLGVLVSPTALASSRTVGDLIKLFPDKIV